MRSSLFLLYLIFFVGVSGLSACTLDWLPLPTATPTQPTATATTTPTPTNTRVWFPPTETHTPLPGSMNRTATPDVRPLSNQIILTDDFSDEQRWEQVSSTIGTASYGVNELTLALKGERGSLYSFSLNQIPNDYYLEMMIEPNLCSGSDQYGVVFRSQSPQEFYRFSMSCDGQVRLDLVRGSSSVRLVETEQSAQLFSGPYAKLRLAFWVQGDGVKVFINDVVQAEYYRLQWYAGGLGLFGRSNGDNALTVSFSDLTMRTSDPLPPTPVPTLTPTPE